MFPMTVAHRATSAVVVVRCARSSVKKLALNRPSAPQRRDLSCNAVPKWKRKNKKSIDQSSQAPQVVRERKPDNSNDTAKPSWSVSVDRRPSTASVSTPTKRIPKWLKRKKGGQASPGTGPRPVGTMVFGVGGVPSNTKRVPRWLRRAKIAGQQNAASSQQPARQPARQPEQKATSSGFSFGDCTDNPSRQRTATQPKTAAGPKRYPKWHRRYKKNPGLSAEQEFAIQRDRMAARHNWNGDRSQMTVSR